jgi:hypothetical protein
VKYGCLESLIRSPVALDRRVAKALGDPIGLRFVDVVGTAARDDAATPEFATGDVRSGSTKRVASAVGDGALVVRSMHAALNRRRAAAD